MNKNNYCFGFVILHYLAYDMTEQCIEQLLSLYSNYNIQIVVVDNGSYNNSGKKLSEKYKDNQLVTVILNSENQGFAKGNNLGFSYLKTNFNCDYIIILNNDVIIDQKDFLNKILEINKKYKFSVLGPDVKTLDKQHMHQSPCLLKGDSIFIVKNKITKLKKSYKYFYLYYFRKKIATWLSSYKFTKNILIHLLKIFHNYKTVNIDYSKYYKNPVLHGACYIVSTEFINKRSYAFNPNTFLYCEEDILYYECIKNNLLIIYSPDIYVTHLEDVSTNCFLKSNIKKEKFKLKEVIKSYQVLLSLMENIEL